MSLFCEPGIRSEPAVAARPFFHLAFENAGGILKAVSRGNYCVSLEGRTVNCMPSFSSVLAETQEPTAMLPLFSLIDAPPLLQDLCDSSLDLLAAVLAIGSGVQRSFAEAGGFAVMGLWMIRSRTCVLQYSTYIRLYAILERLSDALSRRVLLEHILVNFELVTRTPLQTQQRITKHWFHVVNSAYPLLLASVLPVRRIVLALSEFYSETSEVVDEIRTNLQLLLAGRAKVSFTVDDLKSIISYSLNLPNVRTREMLGLARLLIQVQEEPVATNANFLTVVHVVMTRESPDVFLAMMELLLCAHEKGMFESLPLALHVEVILQEMMPNLVTREVLAYLTGKVRNQQLFALIPLCAFVAINLGDADIDEFVSELPPHVLSLSSRSWLVALAANCASDVRWKILRFLNVCPERDWTDIGCAIEAVCRPAAGMLHDFLAFVGQTLEREFDQESVDAFLRLAFSGLFFQPFWASPELVLSFSGASPFRIPDPPSPSAPRAAPFQQLRSRSVAVGLATASSASGVERKGSDSQVFAQRSAFGSRHRLRPDSSGDGEGFAPPDTVFKFGPRWLYEDAGRFRPVTKAFRLRTDRNGDWLDKDIARAVLKLGEKWMHPLYIHFDLLCAAFLLRYAPNDVSEHLKAIRISRVQAHAHRKLFHLIARYADKFDKKVASPLIPARVDLQLAFESLAEVSSGADQFYNSKIEKTSAAIKSLIVERDKQVAALLTHRSGAVLNAVRIDRTELMDEFILQNEEIENAWKRIWESLTSEGAPWAVARTGLERRRTVFCTALRPARIVKELVFPVVETLETGAMSVHNCTLVTPEKEEAGVLEIHRAYCSVVWNGNRENVRGDQIRFVFARMRFNSPRAVEVILWDGTPYFLDLGPNARSIAKDIASLATHLEDPPSFIDIERCPETRRWIDHSLSNFDYLLFLNRIAGRTFSDPALYPIFPWVVTDFESAELDFSNVAQSRDLRKPVGVLNEENITILLNSGRQYFFESAPVTADSIARFRSQSSLASTFADILSTAGDSRELIPEFFSCPDAISGALPAWASTPFDFVYKHRKALESRYISLTLHSWIDLIFGFKQRGPMALSAMNTFAPATIECDIGNDESTIREHGQLPSQLFLDPHPSRQMDPPRPLIVHQSFTRELGAPPILSASLAFDQAVSALICTLAISGSPPSPRRICVNDSTVQCHYVCMRTLVPDATATAQCDEFAAFACSDHYVRVFRGGTLSFAVWSGKGAPLCVSISTHFGLVIAGTAEGFVMVYGLRTGRLERELSVGWAPARVTVSQTWGVIAACGNAGMGQWGITAFAPDGDRIAGVLIPGEVAAWEIGGGVDGAEWVTVMTVGGDLVRFEIGSRDAGVVRPGIRGAIALAFVNEWGAIAVVDDTSIHVLCL
jgi:hypothetical protein